LDKEQPAKEIHINNNTQKKKPVQDKEDLVLSGETANNNGGQVQSPPREGVKFSGKFYCG
jgi:hypothetical protein